MRYQTWNDEDTEQLIKLWRNYSESQVAEKMQRTRNAVAGKLNRLRAAGIELKHPGTNVVLSKPRVYAPRPKRVKPPPTPKPPPKPRVEYPERRWQLVELANDQCHWPTGDIKSIDGMWFCGQAAEPDKPYCEAHCEMAYQARRELVD